jgi:hypothetical protein
MTPADTIRQAAVTLAAAARAQRGQTPAPEDFHDTSLAIEQVLDALFAINGNIGAQLTRLGKRKPSRTVGARTTAQAITAVMDHGRALDIALRQACRSAQAMTGECAQFPTSTDQP